MLQITPYERAVLQLLADGRGSVEIASRLRISRHELETGIASLLATMGARSQNEAVDAACRRGLVVRLTAEDAQDAENVSSAVMVKAFRN
jgi:DNA-binding CsgD family transcriptional regulator